MDFLKEWIIQIDFDEGRFDFLSAGTTPIAAWGECLPFEYDRDGGVRVMATVGASAQGRFLVDTGKFGGNDLVDVLFSRLSKSQEIRVTGDLESVAFTGGYVSQNGRLSRLSLGPFQHENIRVTCSNQNRLSLAYLRRYRLTFDFPGQQLYLAKGRRYAEPDRGSTCGVGLLFKPDRIEVGHINEKGPAYAAGVRKNDVLVEVNDTPVSALKPSEIHNLLTAEGKPVHIGRNRPPRRGRQPASAAG
jgi:hypothetical protein